MRIFQYLTEGHVINADLSNLSGFAQVVFGIPEYDRRAFAVKRAYEQYYQSACGAVSPVRQGRDVGLD